MQVICNYYTILYKGLEYHWTLVRGGGPRTSHLWVLRYDYNWCSEHDEASIVNSIFYMSYLSITVSPQFNSSNRTANILVVPSFHAFIVLSLIYCSC